MENAQKTSTRYIIQVVILVLMLDVLTVMVETLCHFGIDLCNVLLVPNVFCLGTGVPIGLIWRKLASTKPEMLPTFFMATSPFRMLLALVVLTIVFFTVGRDEMVPYILVFMSFYLILIGHHSYFFARIMSNI